MNNSRMKSSLLSTPRQSRGYMSLTQSASQKRNNNTSVSSTKRKSSKKQIANQLKKSGSRVKQLKSKKAGDSTSASSSLLMRNDLQSFRAPPPKLKSMAANEILRNKNKSSPNRGQSDYQEDNKDLEITMFGNQQEILTAKEESQNKQNEMSNCYGTKKPFSDYLKMSYDNQSIRSQSIQERSNGEEDLDSQKRKHRKVNQEKQSILKQISEVQQENKGIRYKNTQLIKQAQKARSQSDKQISKTQRSRTQFHDSVRKVVSQINDQIDANRTYITGLRQIFRDAVQLDEQALQPFYYSGQQLITQLLSQLINVSRDIAQNPQASKRIQFPHTFQSLRDDLIQFVQQSKVFIAGQQDSKQRKISELNQIREALCNDINYCRQQNKRKDKILQKKDEEIKKFKQTIDQLRFKLGEQRDSNIALNKKVRKSQQVSISKRFGDLNFSIGQVNVENQTNSGQRVNQLKVQLADSKKECEQLKQKIHNLEMQYKKNQTAKILAQKQVQNLNRRLADIVGPPSNSSQYQSSQDSFTNRNIRQYQNQNQQYAEFSSQKLQSSSNFIRIQQDEKISSTPHFQSQSPSQLPYFQNNTKNCQKRYTGVKNSVVNLPPQPVANTPIPSSHPIQSTLAGVQRDLLMSYLSVNQGKDQSFHQNRLTGNLSEFDKDMLTENVNCAGQSNEQQQQQLKDNGTQNLGSMNYEQIVPLRENSYSDTQLQNLNAEKKMLKKQGFLKSGCLLSQLQDERIKKIQSTPPTLSKDGVIPFHAKRDSLLMQTGQLDTNNQSIDDKKILKKPALTLQQMQRSKGQNSHRKPQFAWQRLAQKEQFSLINPVISPASQPTNSVQPSPEIKIQQNDSQYQPSHQYIHQRVDKKQIKQFLNPQPLFRRQQLPHRNNRVMQVAQSYSTLPQANPDTMLMFMNSNNSSSKKQSMMRRSSTPSDRIRDQIVDLDQEIYSLQSKISKISQKASSSIAFRK